jgi:hypothetical protein
MVYAPGISPSHSNPAPPPPLWIAIIVLQKLKENDKKLKKIKTLRFPYIMCSSYYEKFKT